MVFNHLLDLDQKPSFAWAYLAEIEMERHHETRAKEYLSQSLKLDKHNPLALNLKSSIN